MSMDFFDSVSAEAISAVVAVIALYAGWLQWRKVELRKEDALGWCWFG